MGYKVSYIEFIFYMIYYYEKMISKLVYIKVNMGIYYVSFEEEVRVY